MHAEVDIPRSRPDRWHFARPCTPGAIPPRILNQSGPQFAPTTDGWPSSVTQHQGVGPECIPIDFHDMDRAIEEVAWARESGFSAA